MNMVFCRKCGSQILEIAQFCEHCGNSQDTSSPVQPQTSALYVNYKQVPWYRKNWFAIVLALIFSPPLLIILITGDVYYERKGQLRTYSKAAKVFLILWGILSILWIAIKIWNQHLQPVDDISASATGQILAPTHKSAPLVSQQFHPVSNNTSPVQETSNQAASEPSNTDSAPEASSQTADQANDEASTNCYDKYAASYVYDELMSKFNCKFSDGVRQKIFSQMVQTAAACEDMLSQDQKSDLRNQINQVVDRQIKKDGVDSTCTHVENQVAGDSD